MRSWPVDLPGGARRTVVRRRLAVDRGRRAGHHRGPSPLRWRVGPRDDGPPLPDVLEVVARQLRAGGSVRSAVLATAADAAHRPHLGDLAAALRAGRSLPEALRTWSGAPGAHDRPLAAAALELAAATGAGSARAVDAVAATLRERATVAAEARALAAPARASAALLAVLPVGFGVVVAALEPAAARFLLLEPVGWACLGVGSALQVGGWWWMRRLVRAC